MLCAQRCANRLGNAWILTCQRMGFALQCLHRILLVASCSVVPALDGRDPKLLRLPRCWMLPGRFCELTEAFLQLARLRWCREQRSNDHQSQLRPAKTRWLC